MLFVFLMAINRTKKFFQVTLGYVVRSYFFTSARFPFFADVSVYTGSVQDTAPDTVPELSYVILTFPI